MINSRWPAKTRIKAHYLQLNLRVLFLSIDSGLRPQSPSWAADPAHTATNIGAVTQENKSLALRADLRLLIKVDCETRPEVT